MKRNYVFPILLAGLILFSCKKDKDNNESPVIPPPASDAQTVLLKDVLISNLPSPYYHFEYDDSGYITKSSFSSGIRSYILDYASRRVSEVKSNHAINKDKMQYQYENGRPFLVKYIDEAGVNFKRCFITYNTIGQVTKMEWDRKIVNTGFAIERTLTFTYYADGNLKQQTDHRHPTDNQQPENTFIDKYENYDNKINPAGFSLIHNSSDHLLLLPGIKLQKNNPRKNIRTGTGINYIIDYNYTYNELNMATFKNGDAVFTNGTNAGQRFQSNTSFTYY